MRTADLTAWKRSSIPASAVSSRCPPALVGALGLPWLCRQQGQLADGTVLTFDVHVAMVDWNCTPRRVATEVTDGQPLVGMSLMLGSELRVQVADGGAVTVL